MIALIQFKQTPTFLTALALVCCGILPVAQAVVPPPDGGYPGFNTAEGTNALKHLTTGVGNTAAGWYSLFTNSSASYNTGLGAGTLALNTADQNTAIGAGALFLNTTGFGNTATGAFALLNSTASGNTAHGASALFSNTIGGNNTATGTSALIFNTDGDNNTANGNSALLQNTSGDDNTAIGFNALENNITGAANTAVGRSALQFSTGSSNTAVGNQALAFSTSGDGNIALGIGAGNGITTASNVICIGAPGADVNNGCYIGQIFGATSAAGIAVFVNSEGKLGTNVSSRRFKDEIKPMGKVSEAILGLQPVTFLYKKELDSTRTAQFGLVAEEVEKVNPDLVVRDKKGEPYSVRYDQVNAMLLNEFLKDHRKVQEQDTTIALLKSAAARQEATIAKQQKQIEALTEGLQNVSVQVELSKAAPQTVLNRQ